MSEIVVLGAAADNADERPEIDLEWVTSSSRPLAPSGGAFSRAGTSADVSLPLAEIAHFAFGADVFAERETWSFEDFNRFIPEGTTPPSSATDLSVQLTALYENKGGWSYALSPTLEYSAANGARLNDSRLLNGALAAFYTTTNKTQIGLGISRFQRMTGRPEFILFPVISWEVTQSIKLVSTNGDSGSLTYTPYPAISIFGELRFNSRERRLFSVTRSADVLRTEDFPVFLGFQFRPMTHLSLTVRGGKTLGQSLEFLRADGTLLRRSDRHAPSTLSLELDARF